MPRGGPRANSGRPKGAVDKSARASKALAKIAMKDAGLQPIEVMFANMVFWHNTSEHLAGKFSLLMEQAKNSSADGAVEILDKCNTLMEQFLEARNNAQKCAVDAAPYCHPRLQAIKLESGDGGEVLEVTMALAKPEAEENENAGRSYRDGYTTVVPIRRSAA